METILTSTVIAAIVAAAVAIWTAQNRISIENITQDRRQWRKKVRATALSVHDALISRDKGSLNKFRAEFMTILNPTDMEDKGIVNCISLPEEGKELDRAEEFAQRVALLLKHDWERVKLEAGPFVMRVKRVRDCIDAVTYKPEREKYTSKVAN